MRKRFRRSFQRDESGQIHDDSKKETVLTKKRRSGRGREGINQFEAETREGEGTSGDILRGGSSNDKG